MDPGGRGGVEQAHRERGVDQDEAIQGHEQAEETGLEREASSLFFSVNGFLVWSTFFSFGCARSSLRTSPWKRSRA